ncbi:MAG TPA: D-alanyl-D-alanine carboxypeptidase family protein [Dyella sp.]|uniref:D-alanyl-D-alanine carboxypeptidase family protein n=1 Tax=Dyella sp. TaxID=1869338 RepID=UPI002B7C9E15|nr:D-alanyl-D-alanine carboxypeptidase family protein [Dyella sp.]HTV86846.1 D-alanyl-D-alanine carboxypeptidase family protein [Dyella sp.]
MAIKSIKQEGVWTRLRSLLAAVVLAGLCVSFAGMARASDAAIVIDQATGQVITDVNADQPNHPASLAKMMTLYITFQQLQSGRLKLDQPLHVSAWAASKAPTKLGLRAGQSITVLDCILGMITKSANDAATVDAEGIGGTEDAFADMMNAQAARLGMTHTHFANASGLPDPTDTTTARDMATLAMALYRDFPQYTQYFATKEFVFRGRLVRGHNHLMNHYPGMDGLKTGFTNVAGYNLASTAVRDGHRLFGVVLAGRTAGIRDRLMARLLDDGFKDRQTPAVLVAAAGRDSSGTARRLLAALSPIPSAEAETVALTPTPAAARHCRHCRRRSKRAASVARTGCTARKKGTAACPQPVMAKRKSAQNDE